MARHGRKTTTADLYISGGILLIVILVSVISYYQNKKRRQAIKDYCFRSGISLDEDPVCFKGISERWELFEKGHTQKFYDLMFIEKNGIEINLCDFSYVTGSGKHRHEYFFTLCQVAHKRANIPDFNCAHEDIFDKIAEKFGKKDIDFSGDKSFSDKFCLTGTNEHQIRKLFTPVLRQRMLAKYNNHYAYRANKSALLVILSGHHGIEDRLAMLEHALAIFKTIVPVEILDGSQTGFEEDTYGDNIFADGNQSTSSFEQRFGGENRPKPNLKNRDWKSCCDPLNG